MTEQKKAIFLKAYEPCHDQFIRYCTALSFAKMDTEDLVQDVLLSAYEHFEKIKRKDQLLHYLIRAARNRSISRWRKSKIQTELLEQHSNQLIAKGTGPEQLVDIQLLYRQLNQLPEKQRDAIMLFEISGFSIKEIAQIQNSSEAAVKTRLSRGRKKLRERMEEKPITSLLSGILGIKYPALNKEILLSTIKQQSALSLIKPYWFLNLQLNPLLMSSIVAPIIVGSMILFMPNNDQKTDTPIVASKVPIITVDTFSQPQNLSQTSIQRFQNDSNQMTANPATDDAIAAIEPLMIDTLFDPIKTQGAKTDFSIFEIPEVNSLESNIRPLLPPPSEIDSQSSSIFDPPAISKSTCQRPLRFTGQVRSLKRDLLNNLKKDKLISSRKHGMLLSFDKDEKIQVNQQLIPEALQGKYKALLGGYGILPCPIRIVEITRQYIAVGDLVPDGFEGHTSGTVEFDKIGSN